MKGAGNFDNKKFNMKLNILRSIVFGTAGACFLISYKLAAPYTLQECIVTNKTKDSITYRYSNSIDTISRSVYIKDIINGVGYSKYINAGDRVLMIIPKENAEYKKYRFVQKVR